MPLRCFRRQYDQLSQFDRRRIITMMEVVCSDWRVARQFGCSDCVPTASSIAIQAQIAPSLGALCLLEVYASAWLKDIWDRGAHYVCCPSRPPIDASVWSGATHEETGLQWNETRSSLEPNPDSISLVKTIVFVCGDLQLNASILPLLYSDTPLPLLL
ncbi:HTH_Tnp_Tc3_2 domain-containing protein [Trichonephila clavipes]|nr:HTH_Tnp_Tc3_2 domain-containing protein [Trichonephila clavipes]